MAAAPLAVVPAPESPAESPAVADEDEEEEAQRLDSAQSEELKSTRSGSILQGGLNLAR